MTDRPKRKAITERMKIDCLLWLAMTVSGWVGIKCPECGVGIQPSERIEWDHRHALVFDGPHEYENLRPVHYACHKKKTKRDVQANAKVKRIRGETKTKPKRQLAKGRKMESRGFTKRVKA